MALCLLALPAAVPAAVFTLWQDITEVSALDYGGDLMVYGTDVYAATVDWSASSQTLRVEKFAIATGAQDMSFGGGGDVLLTQPDAGGEP